MSKKSTSQAAENPETTDRLLDTAERLFGERGYDGVGMRELAAEAQANLGAATYHFGSKKALYIETFMRRFRPINAERLKLLQQAQAEAKAQRRPPTVEKIIECLARPAYVLGLEHPNFNALLARNLLMPPAFLHVALHRELGPNVEAFIAVLSRLLREVPEDLIRLRVMFSTGSLLMFSQQMERLQPARDPKFDENMLKELVRFISAGLQSEPAVSASGRPPFPRPPKLPRS